MRPGDSWDDTILSAEGVHPSGGKTSVYSGENLQTCGYAVRNWVTFLTLREVHVRVLTEKQGN